MIRVNCRSSFQKSDLDFLLSALSHPPGDAPGVLQEGCPIDDLLDRDEVFRALLEQNRCLTVSPQFYFYVLVRHVFVEAGLSDRDLADYVASLLAEFSKVRRLTQVQETDDRRFDYVFEMLEALQSATGPRVFFIRAHVGNTSLFLTGIFPEHVLHQAQRRGAPGLRYFENLGVSNYLTASEHQLARELQLENVLGCLGDRFGQVRHALNQLSDRLVSIERDPTVIQSMLAKWGEAGG